MARYIKIILKAKYEKGTVLLCDKLYIHQITSTIHYNDVHVYRAVLITLPHIIVYNYYRIMRTTDKDSAIYYNDVHLFLAVLITKLCRILELE